MLKSFKNNHELGKTDMEKIKLFELEQKKKKNMTIKEPIWSVAKMLKVWAQATF